MANFHFVEDYEAHVSELIRNHPLDHAMSLAVGGHYREIGEVECNVLRYAGLADGMYVIDLGCGSGRLPHVLSESMRISYLGTDVVQSLLDFARTKCAANYQFKLHRELSIPAADGCADFACAFSVFTHLLHEESYIYIDDMKRVLKPGGKVVFSFIEFARPWHWHVFRSNIAAKRDNNTRAPLNMFIEREAIAAWSRTLGLEVVELIDGPASPHGPRPLGQSIAILRKPMTEDAADPA